MTQSPPSFKLSPTDLASLDPLIAQGDGGNLDILASQHELLLEDENAKRKPQLAAVSGVGTTHMNPGDMDYMTSNQVIEELHRLKERTERTEKELKEFKRKADRTEKKLNGEVTDLQRKLAATEQRLADVNESTSDANEWILAASGHFRFPGDVVAMRRIHLRNLLDRVQAKLAFFASLTSKPYTRGASAEWRNILSDKFGSNNIKREDWVSDFLKDCDNPSAAILLQSEEAVKLVAQTTSPLRVYGAGLSKQQFLDAVRDHVQDGGEHGPALEALVEFLFSETDAM